MDKKAQKLSLLNQLKLAQAPVSLPQLMELSAHAIAERTLRRWLVAWVEQGIVERTGKKRGTLYRYITNPPHTYGQKYSEASALLLNVVNDPSGESAPAGMTSASFLQTVPQHRRAALLEQLRDLWTHNSTALEGNTLTLGDTHAILGMGLTVSGKPLREHQEIVGHAKAIDLLYQCLAAPLSKEVLFDLHKAIQTDIVHDIFKPIGGWKVEKNGTYTVSNGEQVYIEYAHPLFVERLMNVLIEHINTVDTTQINLQIAASHYAKIHMAFVHIHPFWDGNGRLARLIANIPLLKAGLPPLVIDKNQRREYIECLADYQIRIGQLDAARSVEQPKLWPDESVLKEFTLFCDSAYESTKKLIDKAKMTTDPATF